jgi:hypothetical protein
MRFRDLVFICVVLGTGLALGRGILGPSTTSEPPEHRTATVREQSAVSSIVERVNATFREEWSGRGLEPAPTASDLTLMRRLALGLTGTVPSLEEIRHYESRPAESRYQSWLHDLLHDRRTSDYLAERFARAMVGTEDGPFIQFRRRRFTTWLSDAILENRPYDALVRDLIADQGLWTDHPATNFVSVTFDQEKERPDPERLAARVSRCFLGIRLDCAQCHDHPFQPWKQADFQGLAAFFGGAYSSLRGIRDRESRYHPEDRKTKQARLVEPRVPFRGELIPPSGTPREQLAAWVVHPENPCLARATVNRVWAILFNRPLVDPVDDLPVNGDVPAALDLLSKDFIEHGYDLRRLVRTMASLDVFRLESADDATEDAIARRDETWASFPMSRLRPEQVAGAVFQVASLSALGPQSPWVVRFATYTGRNEFIRRYGDAGEDEFAPRGGTIPQRLLLMNGDIARDKTRDGLFNASRRIAELAPSDERAVELAYLTVLTRRPDDDERTHFVGRLAGTRGQERKERLTDLFWTLLNATEFSWNH